MLSPAHAVLFPRNTRHEMCHRNSICQTHDDFMGRLARVLSQEYHGQAGQDADQIPCGDIRGIVDSSQDADHRLQDSETGIQAIAMTAVEKTWRLGMEFPFVSFGIRGVMSQVS